MADNPYEPPETEGTPANQPRAKSPWRLIWVAIPAVVGVGLGIAVLAPLFRGPGDPTGRSIAGGLGGFAGLAIGFLLRFVGNRLKREAERP